MLKIGLTGSIACGKSFIGKLFQVYGVKIIECDIIAREIVQANSPALQKIAQSFGEQCILDNGELDRAYLRELVFADKEKLQQLNQITHPAIHARLLELTSIIADGKDFPVSYKNILQQDALRRKEVNKHKKSYLSNQAWQNIVDKENKVSPPKEKQQENKISSDFANELESNNQIASNLSQTIIRSDRNISSNTFTEPLDPNYVIQDSKPPYVLLDIPLLFENKLEYLVNRILVVDASLSTQLYRIITRDGCSLETAKNIIDKQIPREERLQKADDIIRTDTSDIAEKRQHVLNLHIKYLELARKQKAL